MQITESAKSLPSIRGTLGNVPPVVAGCYGEDLSIALRPIYMEKFEDGSGFVFNADHPSGVTYLKKHAFAVYGNLLGPEGQIPTVDEYNGALYADFVRHGIARSRYVARQRNPTHSDSRQFAVWFHIVNACNLSCRYCYIPNLKRMADSGSVADTVMSPTTIELATQSLFEFCKMSGFSSLLMKFAGGEPALCVDEIRMACEFAKRYSDQLGVSVRFAMLSNGVLLNERICKLLTEYKISISISVDGDMDAHNEVRFTILNSEEHDGCRNHARSGTWNTIAQNIRDLISHGVRPYFMCTVTERNYGSLLGLFQYSICNQIGVRLSMVRDSSSHLRPGLQSKILEKLANLYGWLGQNMPTNMPIENFAAFGDWSPGVKKEAICSACRTYAAVDHRGMVASCQMRLGNSKESILDSSFTDVFSRIQKDTDNLYLIMPSAKTGGCSSCYWKFVCAGGCPEHTRLAVGTPNAPSPWCELFSNLLPHFLRAIALQKKRQCEIPEGAATERWLEID